ncbi:MAG: YabP/YqfC family sporulation protein [Bacilli bacterium]
MKIIDKLTNYIYDPKMSIHIYENHVNITNYVEISNFSSNKLTIKYDKGIITITGRDLVVSKLLNNELLINGEIKQIELG